MSTVVFDWPISSFHGWGLRGLGMALNWRGSAVSAAAGCMAELPPDDPRAALLAERLEASAILADSARKSGDGALLHRPLFVGLGNDLTATSRVRGSPTIACPVFEDEAMVRANIERLREYDRVVVASRWNQSVLAELGIKATLVHEGVDREIFRPGKRVAEDKLGRFRIFSGGKVEFRKAQDLVLEIVRRFSERHDDVVLVAAWSGPFAGRFESSFQGNCDLGPPPGWHIGMPNYHAWAQKAGLRPDQFELVGMLPNWRMADVYRGCDVALFPNRREGGTNFVAMECMACGVPTIYRSAYGMADLDAATALPDYADIDYFVEALERVYNSAGNPVAGGTPLAPYWTWQRHCRDLEALL